VWVFRVLGCWGVRKLGREAQREREAVASQLLIDNMIILNGFFNVPCRKRTFNSRDIVVVVVVVVVVVDVESWICFFSPKRKPSM